MHACISHTTLIAIAAASQHELQLSSIMISRRLSRQFECISNLNDMQNLITSGVCDFEEEELQV